MEDMLKMYLWGLLALAGFLGVLMLGLTIFGPDAYDGPEAVREPSHTARVIDVGNSSFDLHVVTVDGVEYVVSTTYRGVGICPKVVKEEN